MMDTKGKAENSEGEPKNVEPLPYNKIVEDIRRDSSSTNKNHSIGQISVDFETAITKAGYGKFNYFLLLMAIPAACSSGFVTGAVSLILPLAGCDLDLTSFDKGWLNSAPYIGMVVSAFFWGFLSDAFGRQRLLTIGFLVDTLMTIGASLSLSFWPMITFKFFSGIMVCGPYSIFMAYISEMFMDKRRDVAVLSAGIFSALGNIFQPALAMFLMPRQISWTVFGIFEITSWRIFLLACSLPSLLCGIGSAFCVESPKFLLEQGRKEEALNVFKKIYTINTGRPNNTYPVRRLHDGRRPSVIARAGTQPTKKGFCDLLSDGVAQAMELLKPPFVARASFLFFIQFCSMSSLNVLRLWLPQMFTLVQEAESGGNSTAYNGICQILAANSNNEETNCENLIIKSEVFINMIWINSGSLVAHAIFIISVKYLGKKFMCTITTMISAACVVLIPLLSTEYVVPLAAVFMALLNVNFYSVIGMVVETFPTTMRATSVSLTMMFGRIGVLIANIGVAGIMYTHCDLIFFVLFGILIVCGTSSLFLPTSKIEVKHHKPISILKEAVPRSSVNKI